MNDEEHCDVERIAASVSTDSRRVSPMQVAALLSTTATQGLRSVRKPERVEAKMATAIQTQGTAGKAIAKAMAENVRFRLRLAKIAAPRSEGRKR